jgi:transketolase
MLFGARYYEIGKAVTVREGGDAAVIACGIAVMAAIKAARRLEKDGISVRVIDMHTIKPLDREAVMKAAAETGAVVTVEEHSVVGGLGSAAAEVIAEEGLMIKFVRLGIPDIYSAIGSPDELYKRYGIDQDGIYDAVRKIINK